MGVEDTASDTNMYALTEHGLGTIMAAVCGLSVGQYGVCMDVGR